MKGATLSHQYVSGRAFLQRDITHPGAAVTTREVRSSLRRLVICQDEKFAGEDFCWVDKDKHFAVYADVVVLLGDFTMKPGCSFTVVAREIETYGGLQSRIVVDGRAETDMAANGQPVGDGGNGNDGAFLPGVLLCTHHQEAEDGKPGPDGDDGKPGSSGGGAGTITLVAHSLKGPLHLQANGGQGANGGHGSNGGKGGDGGNGNYSNWTGLFGAAHPVMDGTDYINPGDGGVGGAGGAGGAGGNGGDGGRIDVRLATALPADLTWSVEGGKPGQNGRDGASGPGGFRPALQNFLTNKNPQIERRQSGSRAARSQGAVPQAGKAGTADIRTVPAGDLLGFADAIQTEMMLQTIFAGIVVAGLDAKKTPAITEPLGWIEGVLAPITQASRRESLPAESVKPLERAYARVAALLGRLASGRDAFGHDRTYAPTPSLGTFNESLTTNLAAFQLIEAEYQKFLQALEQQQQVTADSTTVINLARAKKSAAEALAASARERLEALQPVIERARQTCSLLRSDVRAMQHELLQVINLKFNFSDVNSLIGAFEMMCFVPPTTAVGAGMALGQIGKLVHNGMTTIASDDGAIEPKDKVIEKMLRLEGSLEEAANAAASTLRDGDESTKVLLTLEQYQQTIEKFRSLDGAPALLDLIATMIEKFHHKNGLLLEYNEQLRTYREMHAHIDECEEAIAKAGAGLSSVSDPSFPLMASFLGTLHDRMKTDIIAKIELANRAYAFYTLDTSYRVLPDLLDGRAPGESDILGMIDAAILTACVDRLRNRLLDKLAEATNDAQPFDGYTCVIDNPTMLAELQRKNRTWFSLDRLPSGARGLHVPGWTTATDVRLTEVAVYLRGARFTSPAGPHSRNLISVGMTHGAFDSIYRNATQAATFTHDHSARYLFVYAPEEGDDIVTHARISCDQVSPRPDRRDYYAGVGPFSSWDLDIEAAANPNLDLSGLTHIEIHFKGYLRPLALQSKVDAQQTQEVIA